MDKEIRIKIASRVAAVAGTIAVFTAVLLLLNFLQLKFNPPTESRSQEVLLEALKEQPNNEALREEIRTIDLMARKALFTKEWQIRTGSYILLIFSVIMLIALRIYFSEKESKSEPADKPADIFTERLISRKWLLVSAALILVLALTTAFISQSEYQISLTKTAEKPDETQKREAVQKKPADSSEAPDTSNMIAEADTLAGDTLATENDEMQSDDEKPETYPSLSTIKTQHNAFRGALSQGIVYVQDIPVEWNVESGENILWKKPVPHAGYNSPIIWGGRLFIAGGNQNSRAVYCYNRNNGILIWKGEADNIPGSPAKPPKTTDDTGLAAPTMTTDGNRVYAIFGTGDIIAFDLDGNREWARNLGVPDNHYGHSSSLVTWQGKLYVQYDTNDSGKLLILDVKTGNTVKEIRRDEKISWSSPILANVGGKYQVILASNPNVVGYDAETGKELWSANCLMGEVGPSPAYYDGLVYAVNEYAKLVAINPTNGSIKWESMDYMSEVSAPVAANGLLFVPTSYGVLACYDAKTGELVWEADFDNGFYSSPMAVGNNIYIFDLGGNGHVIEASRTYNKIATSPIGEKVFATPAFTKGKMYVRGSKNMYCIGK
jgi:outer membrane protein assembly factor BamB